MCGNERTKIKEEWASVTHGVWDRSRVISCLHISVLCGPARLHQFQATLFPTCSRSLRGCRGSFPTSPSMGIAWRTRSKIAGLHPKSLWFSRSGWGWGFAFLKDSQVMLHYWSQDHTPRTSDWARAQKMPVMSVAHVFEIWHMQKCLKYSGYVTPRLIKAPCSLD